MSLLNKQKNYKNKNMKTQLTSLIRHQSAFSIEQTSFGFLELTKNMLSATFFKKQHLKLLFSEKQLKGYYN
jgi:hypothetical protein